MKSVKIIECPRDAMQGLDFMIDTDIKIEYINSLLQVGFDVLDMGSFVSAKAIPQLADTEEVLSKINYSKNHQTKLLTIVANEKGAQKASKFKIISLLGYPFSISEQFQLRNTNKTIAESFETVKNIYEISSLHNQEMLVYISMCFGNPYQEKWDEKIIFKWLEKIGSLGIKKFNLSDTVGIATEKQIYEITQKSQELFPDFELGLHLHSTVEQQFNKIKAGLDAGCLSFDMAIKGYGGCPFASNKLTGNVNTELFVEQIETLEFCHQLNTEKLTISSQLAEKVFK